MNFQRINFHHPSTQKVYDNYINQIEKIVETLPAAEQLDILMEMNSHIYEGMQNSSPANELDDLLQNINKKQ